MVVDLEGAAPARCHERTPTPDPLVARVAGPPDREPRHMRWTALLARLDDAGVSADEWQRARVRLERQAPVSGISERDVLDEVGNERRRRAARAVDRR